MLEQLEIINFESWVGQLFTFHSGVNAFVGLSDNGKSAVLRALDWVCNNNPNNNTFRRTEKEGRKTKKRKMKEATVRAQFSNLEYPIVRNKGSENQYLYGDSTWNAVKTSVPDEIVQLIDIPRFSIQYQTDPHYLISQNPGERARIFNKVAGIDLINRSEKYANSQITKNVTERKRSQAEIARIEEKLENYSFLDDAEKEVNALGDIDKEMITEYNKIKKLKKLQIRWQEIQDEKKRIEQIPIAEIEKELEVLSELLTKINTDQTELNKIERSQKKYIRIQRKKEQLKKDQVQAQKKYDELKPNICTTCNGTGWKG